MDLFKIVFGSLQPYLFDILRITLGFTLFKCAIVIIRSKSNHTSTGGNPYSGATTALIGYLLGRGIPIIIKIIDNVCDSIYSNMM